MTSGIAVLGILVVLGMASVKGFNWSVDFVGGMEAELQFKDRLPVADLRTALQRSGVKDAHIQALGNGEQQFLLRLDKDSLEGVKGTAVKAENNSAEAQQAADAVASGAKVQALQDIIRKELSAHEPKITRVDYVGPQIGKELRNQGFMSLLYAIIGVLAYLAFRFDLRFGSGAVLKLIPDTCAMLAFYIFFWRSFDLTSIAALLTGIGYSVNDVIVVFDRIRENLAHHPNRSFRENINTSLNETLSRTINTSVVTSLSLVGLLVFGTGSIWNFAAAMTVGILGATLTSNFVGSSYLLWFDTLRAKVTRTAAPSKG
jgi:preprotein translocase SecF subunit